MSKVSRLRGARSSIAPYVMTAIGLAVVCTDALAHDLRLDAAVSARRAGAADAGNGARRAEPAASRDRRTVPER